MNPLAIAGYAFQFFLALMKLHDEGTLNHEKAQAATDAAIAALKPVGDPS